MGKKKTIVIVIVAILILLISVGATYSAIVLMNRDKEKVEKQQAEVKEKYKGFKEKADLFVDQRSDFVSSVLEDLYFESVEEDYEKWMGAVTDYQKVVDNVIEVALPVDKVCIGHKYPDQEVRDNCNAYMINYETIMNYFVKDIDKLNTFMDKYYKDFNGDKKKYPKVELDSSKYHYIDVNQDGKFIAKDE